MAPRKKRSSAKRKSRIPQITINLKDPRIPKVLGLFAVLFGLFLVIGFISYLFTWQADQSFARDSFSSIFSKPEIVAQNSLGKFGAKVSHWFFYQFMGISSFIIAGLFLAFGLRLLSPKVKYDFNKVLGYSFFSLILFSITFGFVMSHEGFPYGGSFGNYISSWLISLIGIVGTGLLLIFCFFAMLIWLMDPNLDRVIPRTLAFVQTNLSALFPRIKFATAGNSIAPKKPRKKKEAKIEKTFVDVDGEEIPPENFGDVDELLAEIGEEEPEELIDPSIPPPSPMHADGASETETENLAEEEIKEEVPSQELSVETPKFDTKKPTGDLALEIDTSEAPEEIEDPGFPHEEDEVVITRSDYDPHKDLSNFEMPPIDLLEDYGSDREDIDQNELEKNKNRIVETLANYKIKIVKIKAKVGPTITLYEIIPAPGVKISKIKNLEDDIALSLAALGIRIIAPLPGKGTIGIEVPNKNKEIVSLKTLLASPKFTETKMELPIALGTSISQGIHIADLTRMPHLLIAGATGQGKSVGINDIIISLLYAKHPSELKFVLIDPKKVELSIYETLEKHYLAKLPDAEEPILTDTKKVIHTLNSLCIEMDQRYQLLKEAHVRNIKQYNNKFIKRKLNPEKGHRFLPYIVLVIDEFADLIMVAGKEIETPLTRLAQLARAVGIHLIVATQRPTTKIITGTIKANFPVRIAFRVTGIVDSKTILDYKGADQLIGRGDMLLLSNGEIVRLQCAFVDTPEVDRIAKHIGDQKGYAEAFMLPEFVDDTDKGGGALSDEERDEFFEDAARLIVRSQSGSTSSIQRKLKLGYNRAGRIMDQLEASGIVGPSNGSKPRQVLFPDEYELEKFLNSEG